MLCWPACCCHCCFLPCPAHFCAQAQWFLHVWRLLALLARLLLPLLLPALPCALLCTGVAVSDFLVPACSAGSPAVAIVVACIALHTFVHRHGGLCMFGVCLPCWIACCSHRCCLPCPAHLCAQARWLLRLWCLLALLARLLLPLLLPALPCTLMCTSAAVSACVVLACPAGSPAVAIVVCLPCPAHSCAQARWFLPVWCCLPCWPACCCHCCCLRCPAHFCTQARWLMHV